MLRDSELISLSKSLLLLSLILLMNLDDFLYHGVFSYFLIRALDLNFALVE
jgi:hypothetical protein